VARGHQTAVIGNPLKCRGGHRYVCAAADTFDPAADTFDPAADTFDPAADTFDPAADTFEPPADTFEPPADTFEPPADPAPTVTETFEPWGDTAFVASAGASGSSSWSRWY
jgi:hypothetical protein